MLRTSVPSSWNCLAASRLTIVPTETMAITELTPMTMPISASKLRWRAEARLIAASFT